MNLPPEQERVAREIVASGHRALNDLILDLYADGVSYDEVTHRLGHASAILERLLEQARRDTTITPIQFASAMVEGWLAAIREPSQ